jgi:predicted tellurium resistance membrane protein TerC
VFFDPLAPTHLGPTGFRIKLKSACAIKINMQAGIYSGVCHHAAMRVSFLFALFVLLLCGSASGAEPSNAAVVADWSSAWIQTPGAWATLALLVGLELVLGIDNILVITLAVARIDPSQRDKARTIGLLLALVMRLFALAGASILVSMSDPVASLLGFNLSVKDIILLSGGLFLTWKAVKEIHHCVEHPNAHDASSVAGAVQSSFASAIVQIVLLDAVFSIDSVITAVGLTSHMQVIILAVLVSFGAVLAFARPIGEFVIRHAALKILALSFLICIGMTLILEGLHKHVDKELLYLPMGFALLVEILQMRASQNASSKK